MNRTLRHLLLAAALVFSQQAAQSHVLSHLGRDLAKAGCAGKCIPPLGHTAEQCIAFHAVDSALPNHAVAIEPVCVALPAFASIVSSLPFSPRIGFDPRAPPLIS
jgi:hypothetical protein